MGTIEDRLGALGLELPAPLVAPAGVRLPFEFVRVHGYVAYIRPRSVRRRPQLSAGRVGAEVTLEQAYAAARATACRCSPR